MRLAFLILALLVASASALTPGQRAVILSGSGSIFNPGGQRPSIDCSFTSGMCWVSGVGFVSAASQLTVARASQETCTDSIGVVTYAANNAPCITSAGLQMWETRTNDALWSNDLTQSSTWVVTSVAVAKNATGPDNVLNSATTITATAGSGTILQAITLASQADTYSVYVKCVTCTGAINVAEYPSGTPAFTALTSSNCFNQNGVGVSPNVSTWVRCSVEATVLNPIVGFQIANSGDSIQVFCNQLEPGTFVSPCIPTTTATAVRAADVVRLTTPPSFGSAYSMVGWGVPSGPNNEATIQTVMDLSASANNRASTERNGVSNLALGISISAASQTTLTSTLWSQLVLGKLAMSVAAGSQQLVFNGGTPVTGSGALPVSVTGVGIGNRMSGLDRQFNGNITRAALWPTVALSAGALRQVTQ